MKILESYKDMMMEFVNEVDDNKIIKYKKKDGEQGEMKAGSAKSMPKDHPAKIAWDKMQDDGDGEEKPKGQAAMGGGDFDRDSNRAGDDDADDMDRDARFAADDDEDDRGGSDKVDRVFSNEKDTEEEARKQAADSAEKISDKYGIESDIAGNDQGMSYINIGKGGDYEGDNQITVAANDFGDGSSTGGANKGIQYSIAANGPDAMGGPIVGKMFDTKEEEGYTPLYRITQLMRSSTTIKLDDNSSDKGLIVKHTPGSILNSSNATKGKYSIDLNFTSRHSIVLNENVPSGILDISHLQFSDDPSQITEVLNVDLVASISEGVGNITGTLTLGKASLRPSTINIRANEIFLTEQDNA